MKKLFSVVALGLASLLPVVAYGLSATDYAENKIVDAVLRGQTVTFPATWYFGLYTVCPTDSSAGTEMSGGGYAPVALAANLTNWAGTQSAGSTTTSTGTGGTTSNNVVVTFTEATGAWGTPACYGLKDGASGNIWYYGSFTNPPNIQAGTTTRIPAGLFTVQVDN